MSSYYNECDPYAAQWLRNLIDAGLIAPGDVDERSITDVRITDLAGYRQSHFFAGIGGWSLALRQAGIPDDREVWTGSCPCQPFSAAGKRGGFDDERHLWPAFYGLIAARRPAAVMGEQVAGPDGLDWLEHLWSDLEGANYEVRTADLCAAGVGAPHIRQRLYWMADASGERCEGVGLHLQQRQPGSAGAEAGWCGEDGRVADAERERIRPRGSRSVGSAPSSVQGTDGQRERLRLDAGAGDDAMGTRPGPTNGFWRAADWLYCRDDKWRPVSPGTFPLADGVPARMGRLRAYGNAIVIPVAVEFIRTVMA